MTLPLLLGALIGGFLAYSNGANDNFKGVATLYGSKVASYRAALAWATLTTAAGSLMALAVSKGLVAAFSGKGLVPDAVLATTAFPMSVALAAATTVFLATRLGFPISTTHALIGGLVGTGLVASPAGVAWSKLGAGFALPLLMSPLAAIGGTLLILPIVNSARRRLTGRAETCLCVASPIEAVSGMPVLTNATPALPRLVVLPAPVCNQHGTAGPVGLTASRAFDGLHFLSAGLVGFARGLNDTPKIAALLLVGGALSPLFGIASVAAFMAVGGLLGARKVADVISTKVTHMEAGEALAANLTTGLVVLAASKWGMPVSTTHVSVGSLFGIGAATGTANPRTVVSISLAWIITLPIALVLGAVFFHLLRVSV